MSENNDESVNEPIEDFEDKGYSIVDLVEKYLSEIEDHPNKEEWHPPTYDYNDGTKSFVFNLLKENFSETEDPTLNKEEFTDQQWEDHLSSLEIYKPGFYPNLGKPYTHYKPEPKFSHYYMVLENLYDGTLKPFDPCIYYDLQPNQKPITPIYLKTALDDLRWRDKNAWIEAHLHLIRRFLEPNLDEKEASKGVFLDNKHRTKYQIMSYFSQYGKHFFYEIFSKTEMKDHFQRFDGLHTLIEDAKKCHLIPLTTSKKFESKEESDEAFLEWVSLYVNRDYLPQELNEFEYSIKTLCNMILLMNYFSKGILEQLKLDPSEREYFASIYIAIDKHTHFRDKDFVEMIKKTCLERMFELRRKILTTLRESPSLIDHIHYETYQIRKKFKNSNYPQLTTEYILFNWNNVGFATLNDEEYYLDNAHKPFREKVKNQKKFYDEIRTKIFDSAKNYYYLKARISFDINLNHYEGDEQQSVDDTPHIGGEIL